MRVSSPPFLHPCYYGTDIDSSENLIASKCSVEEIAKLIGADSLGFLPVSELCKLCGSNDFCSACFSGDYPTAVPCDTRKDRFEQKLSEIKK
jgi:amidophosphoribosyltransferase